jgi:predicted transcriptional regulator
MKPRGPRRIAPRLRSGDSREPVGHGLPPHIKRSLKMIAAARNESLSWMLEKALTEYFRQRQPEYRVPKAVTPEQKQIDAEIEARARHKRADATLKIVGRK